MQELFDPFDTLLDRGDGFCQPSVPKHVVERDGACLSRCLFLQPYAADVHGRKRSGSVLFHGEALKLPKAVAYYDIVPSILTRKCGICWLCSLFSVLSLCFTSVTTPRLFLPIYRRHRYNTPSPPLLAFEPQYYTINLYQPERSGFSLRRPRHSPFTRTAPKQ